MILAAALAAMLGAGVWLVARALVPPARPLQTLSAELVAPRAERRPSSGADVRRWWHRLAARLSTGTSARLAADLAVLGRTPTRHTLDKLGYALLFGLIALVPAVLLPTLDAGVSPLPMALAALLFAGAGWCYPDVEVRSRAAATRRAWAQTLTVYVDIVGISLAGGAGVEEALMVAAGAGSGPQFEELAATLRAAQTRAAQVVARPRRPRRARRHRAAARAGGGRRPGCRVRIADPRDAARQGQRDARPPAHRRRGGCPAGVGDDGHRAGTDGRRRRRAHRLPRRGEVLRAMTTITTPPHRPARSAPTMPIQIQILTAFLVLRDQAVDALRDRPRRRPWGADRQRDLPGGARRRRRRRRGDHRRPPELERQQGARLSSPATGDLASSPR